MQFGHCRDPVFVCAQVVFGVWPVFAPASPYQHDHPFGNAPVSGFPLRNVLGTDEVVRVLGARRCHIHYQRLRDEVRDGDLIGTWMSLGKV